MPNPGYLNPKHRIIANTPDDPVNATIVGAIEAISESAPPNAGKVTTMTVTDVATKIPVTPAANRVGVEIFNMGVAYGGTGEKLYWNFVPTVTTVLADGTDYGKVLVANESSNFQLSGGADVYAIAETGKTVRVQITEWIRN